LADAGDYYIAGKTFGPETIPNSKRYNGTFTGISVNNITSSGNLMSFALFIPPCVFDFDGDGDTDVLWQNTLTGQVAIWVMSSNAISTIAFPGTVGDLNWQIKN